MSPPPSLQLPLIISLVSYASIFSIIYINIRNPIFFQISYGILVVITTLQPMRFLYQLVQLKDKDAWATIRLFIAGILCYGIGLMFWSIDNAICSQLDIWRRSMNHWTSFIYQLHAW